MKKFDYEFPEHDLLRQKLTLSEANIARKVWEHARQQYENSQHWHKKKLEEMEASIDACKREWFAWKKTADKFEAERDDIRSKAVLAIRALERIAEMGTWVGAPAHAIDALDEIGKAKQ